VECCTAASADVHLAREHRNEKSQTMRIIYLSFLCLPHAYTRTSLQMFKYSCSTTVRRRLCVRSLTILAVLAERFGASPDHIGKIYKTSYIRSKKALVFIIIQFTSSEHEAFILLRSNTVRLTGSKPRRTIQAIQAICHSGVVPTCLTFSLDLAGIQ
jgi:hypothetical protein